MGLSPPTQRTSRVLGRTDKTRPPQERGAHTRNDRRLSDSRTGQTDLAGARQGRNGTKLRLTKASGVRFGLRHALWRV